MATTPTTTRPTGASPSNALQTRRLSVAAFLALAGVTAAAQAVATGAAIPMPAPDPDADLIALAADLREAEAAYDAVVCRVNEAGNDPCEDADCDAAAERIVALIGRMAEAPASSLMGIAAKAGRLVASLLEGGCGGLMLGEDKLVHSLADDLRRLAPEAAA